MFDIGWMEMLVIAVVAIVVIGPKDLPKVMHTVGQWMARARAVAKTFQDQMEEMARQAGVDEVRKELNNSIGGFDPAKRLQQAIDPNGEMEAQMKAMTDLGRLTPDDAPTPTSAPSIAAGETAEAAALNMPPTAEAVAIENPTPAEAEPAVNPRALPDDLVAEDRKPESPLEPGATSYKGPNP
ncbi:MAG TPA: Sec-independent protein translocase protein TatB [Alphaproteobacteria bacterium]|jgi:sec-independent protein translocase protein TatB